MRLAQAHLRLEEWLLAELSTRSMQMHKAAAKEMDDRHQLLCSLEALCRNLTMVHLVFIIEENMSIVLYEYPVIQLVFLSHCFGFEKKGRPSTIPTLLQSDGEWCAAVTSCVFV